ncbi:hypothetical protein [Oceanicoccus sp. KOV_DT_Chl]|uniref:hypothetical protein n=1 Tax=Oceanicoccus sp. KOV_DT_Chl TaxID=1904639 RepID=UPI0011AF7263|nr:hypothetical protein [Oceanicoccus sp. KOV_DT_Chl]
MTINIMTSSEQLGKKYNVMATLYLPTLWSGSSVSSLQQGLANALARYFKQAIDQVHIITVLVEPGMVVEAGKEQVW